MESRFLKLLPMRPQWELISNHFPQEKPKHEGSEEEGQRQLGEDKGGGEGGEKGGEKGEEGQDPHPRLLQGGGGAGEEGHQGDVGKKLVEEITAAAWQKTKVLTHQSQ